MDRDAGNGQRSNVLVCAALLGLIATPFAVKAVLHLDTDLFNQSSAAMPRFQAMREASETFGGELFAAVVTLPDVHTPAEVEAAKGFALLLSDDLSALGKNGSVTGTDSEERPWLLDVSCRSGQSAAALRALAVKYPQLALRREDVQRLKALFEPPQLAKALEMASERIKQATPQSPEKLRIYSDPLDLLGFAERGLRERLAGAVPLRGAGADDFFLSPDGTTLLVVARAAQPASNLVFGRALVDASVASANRTLDRFRAANPEAQRLQVGFTGAAPIYVENDRTLRRDAILNVATSLLATVLLFAALYRSLGITWKIVGATVYTIWLTLGLAGLVRGHVSALGLAFTAVPIGLGTDYAILVVNNLQDARTAAADFPALGAALRRSARSVISAAVLTAIAFAAIGCMSLRGLSEFGILGAASAIVGCVVMLVVLPALLSEADAQAKNSVANASRIAPAGVRMPRGMVLSASVVILLAAAATVYAGFDPRMETVAFVRFDSELGNLRSSEGEAVPLRQRIAQRFGLGLAEISVIVSAADEDAAFAALREIERRAGPFIAAGELRPAGAPLSLFPAANEQRETLAALKGFDISAAKERFHQAVVIRFGERGLRYFVPFDEHLDELAARISEAQPAGLREVLASGGALLSPYVRLNSEGSERVKLRSAWLPRDVEMPRAWHERLAAAFETPEIPGARVRVASGKLTGFELKDTTLRDCGAITLGAAAAILIALALLARSVHDALLAGVPLVYGWGFLLAGVPISGWLGWDYSLNFINLIVFPLLLGSAVDYGVYVVFALWRCAPAERGERLPAIVRAVLFCILTTVIGFGSFVTSSFSGLRSLGIASLWAYAGASFGALVVLPALLRGKGPALQASERPTRIGT